MLYLGAELGDRLGLVLDLCATVVSYKRAYSDCCLTVRSDLSNWRWWTGNEYMAARREE